MFFADSTIIYHPTTNQQDYNALQEDIMCNVHCSGGSQTGSCTSTHQNPKPLRVANKRNITKPTYTIHNHDLQITDTSKYLGIHIHSTLNLTSTRLHREQTQGQPTFTETTAQTKHLTSPALQTYHAIQNHTPTSQHSIRHLSHNTTQTSFFRRTTRVGLVNDYALQHNHQHNRQNNQTSVAVQSTTTQCHPTQCSLQLVQRLRITFSSDCAFCDKITKIGTLVVLYIYIYIY